MRLSSLSGMMSVFDVQSVSREEYYLREIERMKRHIIREVIWLIGMCMALCHTGSIKAYAKEDDGFFLRGGVQSTIRI